MWSAWNNTDLLGCGALKALNPAHGEIKSMRTATRFQRRGTAAKLLERILQEAKNRNYQRVSLETGSMEAFLPAKNLYTRFGFEEWRDLIESTEQSCGLKGSLLVHGEWPNIIDLQSRHPEFRVGHRDVL